MSCKVLGIESSCDDSSAAIVDDKRNILSNVVISQDLQHQPYMGVVPEIAARSHLVNIEVALDKCISESNICLNDIDAVAATTGPGLIGGVIVGSMFARTIASVLNKPFIAINHLEGHALTAQLSHNILFPYLLFLASGGHCQFIVVQGLGKYKILGRTLDDSIGESFDKVAKMMGLGFPGGPIIEKLSISGDSNKFDFPRPLYNKDNSDMSFSGLKTAVSLQIQKLKSDSPNYKLSKQDICDIAASFQRVVSDVVVKKTRIAIKQCENICNIKNIVISGGVGANLKIRSNLKRLSESMSYEFIAPPISLCTDNAAMIAFSGLRRLELGKINTFNPKPRARWGLEELEFVDL